MVCTCQNGNKRLFSKSIKDDEFMDGKCIKILKVSSWWMVLTDFIELFTFVKQLSLVEIALGTGGSWEKKRKCKNQFLKSSLIAVMPTPTCLVRLGV